MSSSRGHVSRACRLPRRMDYNAGQWAAPLAPAARCRCGLCRSPLANGRRETPQRPVTRCRQPARAVGRHTDGAQPAAAPCSGPHPQSKQGRLACMGRRKGAQGRRGPVNVALAAALDGPSTGPRPRGLLQTSSRSTNQQRTASPPISALGLSMRCASSPVCLHLNLNLSEIAHSDLVANNCAAKVRGVTYRHGHSLSTCGARL